MSIPRFVPRRSSSAAVLVAGVALSAAAQAQPPDGYDLPRILTEATARSHDLRASRSREDGIVARYDEATAVRYPVVTARASYDYASEVNRIDVPLGPNAGTIEFGDGHTALTSVGVEVPVYTGGTLSARAEAAAAEVRAAGYDVASDSLAVVHDARAAFFRALGAEATARSVAVAVQRLERHRDDLENQVQLGAASREAVVMTLARLRQTEQQELAAREIRDTARLDLGRIVGRPGKAIAPRGDLDVSLLAGIPTGEMNAGARPELSAVASRRDGADLEARAARGAYLPSVRARAGFLYGRPGVEVVRNRWMSWASAGVLVTWDLWDWNARKRRVEQATAVSRALDAERDSVQRLLEHALGTARQRVASARDQVAKADERVAAERERFELANGRYEEGMARENELLDAHDDLTEAEANAAVRRAALRLAEVDLLYAVGR